MAPGGRDTAARILRGSPTSLTSASARQSVCADPTQRATGALVPGRPSRVEMEVAPGDRQSTDRPRLR